MFTFSRRLAIIRNMNIPINIQYHPECPATIEEIRALATSVFALYIFEEMKISDSININIVKEVIERGEIRDKANIMFNKNNPQDHQITVSFAESDKGDFLMSIYHELFHLFRALNGQTDARVKSEELRNELKINQYRNSVELLSTVLCKHSEGELYESDSGTRKVVRGSDTRDTVGLQISYEASETF